MLPLHHIRTPTPTLTLPPLTLPNVRFLCPDPITAAPTTKSIAVTGLERLRSY